MDHSPSGSSVHGIFEARILVLVARSFSRRSSQLRDQTQVHKSPALVGGLFTTEPPGKPSSICYLLFRNISSVQFSSVAQSCLTLCNPMNCSTPGLPVYHQLPEFTQTHVHQVSDAIQPSHPLSSPSPPAPDPSQHQSLFQ